MRLWPRSMIGQLMLAVALTLFAAQSANLWLLARAQREQFLTQMGSMAASRLIDALEREERGEILSRDAVNPRLRVWVSADIPKPPVLSRTLPSLAAQVRELLDDANIPAQQVVAWHVPPHRDQATGRAMVPRVVVTLYDGRRWVTVRGRAPRGGERLSALLIGQTLLLYLVLLVPILLIAWRVSRPLSQLTQSVRGAVPGGRAEPLVPSGPSDVRDLMTAFNGFRGRITSMLADKDRMLGAVGHDLRTPLASLRVRVEQVDDDALREKMIASIDEMAAMLADILALARSGAGLEAASRIRLGPWLDALTQDYAERGLPVQRVAGADDAAFVGRAMLLTRAVRNLIDNALAYGERAYVQLSLDGGDIAIIIADDGPGIDPAKIGALMEPFARGEESRSRATGGAGLGLTLAKNIAEGEGGRLELVNRADGRGLDARILLPLQQ
jgi:signal transduction histidine kinase